MTILAAIGIGLLIGLSLGAVGGGGSILTVPALVYVLGQTARESTTESLVIVGITALIAAVGHARSGRVNWRAGLAFGAVGILASYAGTAANRSIDPDLLLLAFAGLIVVAAAAMVRQQRRPGPARHLDPAGTDFASDAAGPGRGPEASGAGLGSGSTATALVATASRPRAGTPVALKVVVAGLAVGFLTGFFGVGGGFIIVPALVAVLGYSMPAAVGTSLLVIAVNSAAALLARTGHVTFHWSVIIPVTAAAIAGSLFGKRIADRARPAALARAFVVLMVIVAGYVAIRSGGSLITKHL